MTRLHYTSRPNSRPGRAYRGMPTPRPQVIQELVPVEGGLHLCPVCHGGVKLVFAPYSDRDAGIVHGKSLVLGSHRTGGRPGGKLDKCAGSHRLVK